MRNNPSPPAPAQAFSTVATLLSTGFADGVSIRDLAEYLGHHDPSVTLRIYGHKSPGSHECARAIVDRRLYRPRAVSGASGASLRLVTPDDQPPAR